MSDTRAAIDVGNQNFVSNSDIISGAGNIKGVLAGRV